MRGGRGGPGAQARTKRADRRAWLDPTARLQAPSWKRTNDGRDTRVDRERWLSANQGLALPGLPEPELFPPDPLPELSGLPAWGGFPGAGTAAGGPEPAPLPPLLLPPAPPLPLLPLLPGPDPELSG